MKDKGTKARLANKKENTSYNDTNFLVVICLTCAQISEWSSWSGCSDPGQADLGPFRVIDLQVATRYNHYISTIELRTGLNSLELNVQNRRIS